MEQMLEMLKQDLSPTNAILFVLLVISEILGSSNKFKSSSIFTLMTTILMAIKNQVMPKTQ